MAITHPNGSRSLATLFFAEAVSTLGTEMAAVALPWFMLVTSGSPRTNEAVLAAEFAGITLCGIPSGHLAAVLGPKRTMIVSDLARAVLIALIPTLHWAGLLSLPWLLTLGFAVGAFFPACASSQWIGMSRLVGEDESRLARVGGLFGAVNEGASFAGPALGGILVAVMGPAPVLLLDAVSFLIPVVLVAAVMPSTPAARRFPGRADSCRGAVSPAGPPTGPAHHRSQRPGHRLDRHDGHPAGSGRFDGGARLAGWFLAAYGAGAVVGGLITTRIKSQTDYLPVLAVCGFAVSTWLLLIPLSPWLVIAAVATGGVCYSMFFAYFFATLAVRTPSASQAKVMTAVNTALSATGPLGFVAAGPRARPLGYRRSPARRGSIHHWRLDRDYHVPAVDKSHRQPIAVGVSRDDSQPPNQTPYTECRALADRACQGCRPGEPDTTTLSATAARLIWALNACVADHDPMALSIPSPSGAPFPPQEMTGWRPGQGSTTFRAICRRSGTVRPTMRGHPSRAWLSRTRSCGRGAAVAPVVASVVSPAPPDLGPGQVQTIGA
ncbi:MFS transporter [Streptomyces sp. NPDC088748]|uniref:MFS transporter n=1 Tax=Streptomyces sp. NPDC088748 TaxID=3365887 RepID=UPI00381FB685